MLRQRDPQDSHRSLSGRLYAEVIHLDGVKRGTRVSWGSMIDDCAHEVMIISSLVCDAGSVAALLHTLWFFLTYQKTSDAQKLELMEPHILLPPPLSQPDHSSLER